MPKFKGRILSQYLIIQRGKGNERFHRKHSVICRIATQPLHILTKSCSFSLLGSLSMPSPLCPLITVETRQSARVLRVRSSYSNELRRLAGREGMGYDERFSHKCQLLPHVVSWPGLDGTDGLAHLWTRMVCACACVCVCMNCCFYSPRHRCQLPPNPEGLCHCIFFCWGGGYKTGREKCFLFFFFWAT